LRQDATIAHMIRSVPALLSELSELFELAAGDLVFTGTPAGVAALAPGDQVEAVLEGVAELTFRMEGGG
ncbi:MAG: fumarylacetoacetate hydrolase family protein, partial [Pseudomonadota bacterium]